MKRWDEPVQPKARGLLQFGTSRCRDPWFGALPADLGRAQNGPSAGAEINQNGVRRLDVWICDRKL
jgi:hypothetical protein